MEEMNNSWTDPNINCDALYDCFIYVFDLGVRWGEGIGNFFQIPQVTDRGKFYKLNAFQILFFFIINLIFLNVIFGIIVDTFSQLRYQSDARGEDQNNVTFFF